MYNIVYITGSLSIAGGIGRIVTQKANWFSEKGHKVTILEIAFEHKGSYYELNPKVNVISLHVDLMKVYENKKNLLGFIKSGFDRIKQNKKLFNALSYYLCQLKPDIVFTTTNIPCLLKIKDGSKKVYETHFSSQGNIEFLKSISWLKRFLYSFYSYPRNRALSKYDKVVLLTKKDTTLSKWPDNIIVIPNFITIDTTNVIPSYNSKHVISVGRLDYPKGYEFLIEAWAIVNKKHPDWKLDIYGYSYGRREYFQKNIDKYNLIDVITIYDPVSDIQTKYLESAFYVMSSRYEGFPLVLGEAMSCGLPCISYNCNCGPSEIITDGVDGIIVPKVGDVEGLSDAVCYLIEDPKKRRDFGIKARENIQRFSLDEVMQKWVILINDLV